MKSYLLRPLYDRVIQGLPALGTPDDVARRFRGSATREEAADRIVTLYTGLGGSAGFAFGLPGWLLMPITLPANLTTVAALQLHLSAAIARLADRDLADPATRDECIRCLLDRMDHSGENSEEEEVTSRTGVKLAERGVRFVAEKATRLAGRAARSVVLRKTGAKRLPFIGGVLGAGSDGIVTRHVGLCAKERFLGGEGE